MARFLPCMTWAVVAVGLLMLMLFGSSLPDEVATSFDGSGRPRGSTSRSTALVLLGLVQVLPAAGMALLPQLVRRMPDHLINMPHREHYLAPERRERTLDRMELWMSGVAGLTAAFFTGMTALILWANHQPEPSLGPGFWILLLAYLASVTAAIIALHRSFPAPTDDR